MASSSGPRAAGTDGTDHKYRQRVDSHYQLMASARKTLATAANAHAVAAALAAADAMQAAALGADLTDAAARVLLALLAGAAAAKGLSLSKASRSPGGAIGRNKALSGLAFGADALYVAVGARDGVGVGLALCFAATAANLVGLGFTMTGGSALDRAFKMQAEKRAK